MRIALIGPFDGPALESRFEFVPREARLPPGYPGSPLTSVLARALVDRGHTLAAITTDYTLPPERLEPFKIHRARGLSAYFCPQRARSFRSSGGRRGRALDFFAYERRHLLAALRDFVPDVVHAHWTYEFAWAALDSGYPALATAHDSPWKVLRFMPNPYRAARYLMARLVIPRCTHLTAVSPDLAADIRKFTRIPVKVVANPIPPEVASALGCSAHAFDSGQLVMVLNGWSALKNGTTALRAFALARRSRPALRLVCLGNGWEANGPAHRWARTNAAADGVEFRGPVPHRMVLREMQRSAALLHPSRGEACSMAIAEAMSLGLPVIAGRRTDGVGWQLDQGRAGVLVDVNDARDIARGIEAATADFAIWLEMSAAARRRARELFSIDRVVDEYLSLYEAVRRAGEVAGAAVRPA